MKEKLLKLIQACIDDKLMYIHTYNGNKYIGINERLTRPRTSYVISTKYKGKEIKTNGNSIYECDLIPYHKQDIEGYELFIGFGDEPQLTIKLINKGNTASQPKEVIKVEGKRDGWLTSKTIMIDVTVVTEEYHYELRCGSFAYIIEDSLAKAFYEKVQENAKYKKGDFIKNVTGIIKIDTIGYNTLHNITEITYTGYPYKMGKGIPTRTKDTKKRTLVYNITPV